MVLPLKYNFRNVLVRWRTTVFTVLGIAAVVAVFVLLRGMARGIEHSSGNTGDPRNILVVRRGSQAESGSIVSRDQFRTLQYFEEIARNERNEPVISAELVLAVSAPRRDAPGEANTLLRGITPRGMELRPQVTLKAGRWFIPGKREVVVAQRLASRFAGFEVGGTIKAGRERFTVVGHFDATGSAFDSEVWMDADEARAIFDRDSYSSILLRPRDEASLVRLIGLIQADKRLSLRAEREVDYYAKQTQTAVPIKYLAGILGVAMSVGAVFAAMNTMYASVAARTREIGTLRVLGFSRLSIVLCFLIEGAFLAMLGGVLGSFLAWGVYAVVLLRGINFGTMDFQSFAETVFQFRVTPDLMLLGVLFSAAIGLAGSLLPALRAARLPVISALKSL
ncbi:MAG TPA: ABC transporter permease [Candidatus Limnocylindria bacterium]|jgi:putative ABC transport system permease protein|nr:ABC transporter permease [Candidatus Limnocylindria bacterium]